MITKKKLMGEIDDLKTKLAIERSNGKFYEDKYDEYLTENNQLRSKIKDLETKLVDLNKKLEIFEKYPSPPLSDEDKIKMYCDLKVAEIEKKYDWLLNLITLQYSSNLNTYYQSQQLYNLQTASLNRYANISY